MDFNDVKFSQRVRAYLEESADVKRAVAGATVPSAVSAPAGGMPEAADRTIGAIVAAARRIAEAFAGGGKLLLCGNGGSAADCQHMAAEFTNILDRSFERRPLPAIALTTDTSFLTSFVNDSGRFAEIFSRQVEALGRSGDVLLGISTSGSSGNVIEAIKRARSMGMATVTLTGSTGELADFADVSIRVPSSKTSHIQEAHLAIEHVICELVEELIFPNRQQSRAAQVDAV